MYQIQSVNKAVPKKKRGDRVFNGIFHWRYTPVSYTNAWWSTCVQTYVICFFLGGSEGGRYRKFLQNRFLGFMRERKNSKSLVELQLLSFKLKWQKQSQVIC